ncbi:MAG: hypothetical protein EOO43_12165 [Flavobacterium sp.]|nr:MAG: hypothetical protein EOO43_12165 [Flavobacterium sp.]
MQKPKLGFKLWFRKWRKSIGRRVSLISTSNSISFIIGCLGLYLAFVANKLADNANRLSSLSYQLSQNDSLQNIRDSSRQVQIEKLERIILLIQDQMNLNGSQLSLLRKADSIATSDTQILYRNDESELALAIGKLIVKWAEKGYYGLSLKKLEERILFVEGIVSIFESQMKNRVLQTDMPLKKLWIDAHRETKQFSIDLNSSIRSQQSLPQLKRLTDSIIFQKTIDFEGHYDSFLREAVKIFRSKHSSSEALLF